MRWDRCPPEPISLPLPDRAVRRGLSAELSSISLLSLLIPASHPSDGNPTHPVSCPLHILPLSLESRLLTLGSSSPSAASTPTHLVSLSTKEEYPNVATGGNGLLKELNLGEGGTVVLGRASSSRTQGSAEDGVSFLSPSLLLSDLLLILKPCVDRPIFGWVSFAVDQVPGHEQAPRQAGSEQRDRAFFPSPFSTSCSPRN